MFKYLLPILYCIFVPTSLCMQKEQHKKPTHLQRKYAHSFHHQKPRKRKKQRKQQLYRSKTLGSRSSRGKKRIVHRIRLRYPHKTKHATLSPRRVEDIKAQESPRKHHHSRKFLFPPGQPIKIISPRKMTKIRQINIPTEHVTHEEELSPGEARLQQIADDVLVPIRTPREPISSLRESLSSSLRSDVRREQVMKEIAWLINEERKRKNITRDLAIQTNSTEEIGNTIVKIRCACCRKIGTCCKSFGACFKETVSLIFYLLTCQCFCRWKCRKKRRTIIEAERESFYYEHKLKMSSSSSLSSDVSSSTDSLDSPQLVEPQNSPISPLNPTRVDTVSPKPHLTFARTPSAPPIGQPIEPHGNMRRLGSSFGAQVSADSLGSLSSFVSQESSEQLDTGRISIVSLGSCSSLVCSDKSSESLNTLKRVPSVSSLGSLNSPIENTLLEQENRKNINE